MDAGIFGIGIWELALVFILLLVVAGPQRMIRWAYIIGRYTSKIQGEFQKAVAAFKQEIEASGLNDVTRDLPRPPKQFDAVAEAKKLINPEPNPPVANTTTASTPATNSPANGPEPSSPSADQSESKYDAWQVK